MIFVDSNIPMYLVGAAHAHKADAQRLLERCALERTKLVTSAEVFQEILHRYVAIQRLDAIHPAFEALHAVVDEVVPIDHAAVRRAKEIVLGHNGISARDGLHLAVMEQHGVQKIMSFDRGFDRYPGVVRLR